MRKRMYALAILRRMENNLTYSTALMVKFSDRVGDKVLAGKIQNIVASYQDAISYLKGKLNG